MNCESKEFRRAAEKIKRFSSALFCVKYWKHDDEISNYKPFVELNRIEL